MRWFKHMTSANRDESLLQIRDEFGVAGYGVYWIILELIGEKITEKNESFLKLSKKNWRKFCEFSPKKFQKFLKTCENLELFLTEIDGDFITVSCPKILKYRDEWTKKKGKRKPKNSGAAPEQRRSKELETEAETERELPNGNSCGEPRNDSPPPPPKTKPRSKPPEPVFLEIPLAGKAGLHAVTMTDVAEYQQAYPGIDVHQELRNCQQWNNASPERRKTKTGIKRHITTWLGKAQNSRRGPNSKSGRMPNGTTLGSKRMDTNLAACQAFIDED